MLTRTEFRLAELKVRVYNANTFTRNHLIGEHNFNLEKINATGNDPNDTSVCEHQLFMKWVVLANPETPHLEGGFLRCTITVLTGDDRPPSHSSEEYQDELGAPLATTLRNMMLIPPTVIRRAFELNARIWSGRLNNPFSGKVSPQIRLSFNGVDMKSDRITRNNEPVWNQQLVLPVMTPCLSEYIRIELWDDGILSKKLIGIAEYLKWNNLVLNKVGPIWINFYGEPQIPKYRRGFWGWLGQNRPNYRRKIKDRGDTAYLGRILAMFDVVSAVTPRKTRIPLPGKDMSWQSDYILRVDLYAGTEIPIGAFGKVQVEVTFGRFTRTTDWNRCIRTKRNEHRPWWKEFSDMNKLLNDDDEAEVAKPANKDDNGKDNNKGKPMTAKQKKAAEEAKKEAALLEEERAKREMSERDEEYMRHQDLGSRQQVIFTCEKDQRINGSDKASSKNKVPGCQFVEFHIPMPDTNPEDNEVQKQQFFDVVINVFVKTFWGRKRIGFLRYSPFELWTSTKLATEPAERPPKWRRIQGIADENGHVKQQPPGFLLCSLNFGKKKDMPPRQEMQKFKDEKRYMLQAFVYQARNLKPANENSLANPFVEVSLGGRYAKLYRSGIDRKQDDKFISPVQVQPHQQTAKEKKTDPPPRYCYRTSCRPHDLNPVWYQTLMIEELSLPLPPSDEVSDEPAFRFTVTTVFPVGLRGLCLR